VIREKVGEEVGEGFMGEEAEEGFELVVVRMDKVLEKVMWLVIMREHMDKNKKKERMVNVFYGW